MNAPSTTVFRVHVVLALVVGSGLRMHDLAGQFVLSDEWHGPHAALNATWAELAALLTLGATSVPSNLYYEFLLGSIGLSEWTLRMPSVLAGVLAIGAIPWLLRRSIGDWASMATAWLLAVSPLLVFYSRYARPYALVVLLTFLAFLACRRWAATGHRSAGLAFVAAAVLAGYFHLLEVRSLLIPLVCLVAAKGIGPRLPMLRAEPSWRAIGCAGLAGCAALALLFTPALLSPSERFFQILGEDSPTAATLVSALALLGGTNGGAAFFVLLPLALLGTWRLVARDPWLGSLFAAVAIGCLVPVFGARPVDSDVALVFARYTIPLLPIGAVLLACGADLLIEWLDPWLREGFVRTSARSLALFALVLGLAAAGPLPSLYSGANAFTNHKAFHSSYEAVASDSERFARFLEQMKWRGPPPNVAVSDFYRMLADETDEFALIEYPMPIGDLFSPGFIHQRIHGKQVLGGWVPRPAPREERAPGVVYANWWVGDVLAGARRDRTHFRSLVSLRDREAVRASGARYLVLHRDLRAERLGWTPKPERLRIADTFEANWGAPVFADTWILVYDLRER